MLRGAFRHAGETGHPSVRQLAVKRGLAWTDYQKAHRTIADGHAAITTKDPGTYRLMRVTEDGRSPEPNTTRTIWVGRIT